MQSQVGLPLVYGGQNGHYNLRSGILSHGGVVQRASAGYFYGPQSLIHQTSVSSADQEFQR